MGKGGQNITDATGKAARLQAKDATKANDNSSSSSSNDSTNVWKSPYQPLTSNITLPTKGQIRDVIPAECFERSYVTSMLYLFRDTAMAVAFVYATSQLLSTDIPIRNISDILTMDGIKAMMVWSLGWMTYGFWMGTIMTGPWVLAHECGHGAFSPNQTFNDVIGFIVHQFLLVPYFAWQYTHAKHHRRTNHLQDGESHVPSTAAENGYDPVQQERHSLYAALHEAMGDGVFAMFQIVTHLYLGWPIYLLGFASTGKWRYDGTPLAPGEVADHFRLNSPMFTPKVRGKILLSTITEIASLFALFYTGHTFGHLKVFLWYWLPYFTVNAWLVLYTWLQHTDPSVPHYGEGEWTWVRGALSTIDRPYGIFDFFHHTIGSTHVVHHLFHEMPWYNAGIATKHVKEYLEPMGLYNYDPTFWVTAMWRIAHTCHYVDTDTGIQYFKSFDDAPRRGAPKAKKA
jgi:omega-6 fatty acid desaturase / acyl-lipid omega-6 desaturase (Delta-12 desaturase)